jgi:hypothetical protein
LDVVKWRYGVATALHRTTRIVGNGSVGPNGGAIWLIANSLKNAPITPGRWRWGRIRLRETRRFSGCNRQWAVGDGRIALFGANLVYQALPELQATIEFPLDHSSVRRYHRTPTPGSAAAVLRWLTDTGLNERSA